MEFQLLSAVSWLKFPRVKKNEEIKKGINLYLIFIPEIETAWNMLLIKN